MHFNNRIEDFAKKYPIDQYYEYFKEHLQYEDDNKFIEWFFDNILAINTAFTIRLKLACESAVGGGEIEKILKMSFDQFAKDCYVTIRYHEHCHSQDSSEIDEMLNNL
jgi:hypothetical protein